MSKRKDVNNSTSSVDQFRKQLGKQENKRVKSRVKEWKKVVAEKEVISRYRTFYASYLVSSAIVQQPIIKLIQNNNIESDDSFNENRDLSKDKIYSNSIYKNGIVAGTFDRLHIGHKILLSESVLLVQNKLSIGITESQMLSRKTLCELIEPLNTRIENVRQFLNAIAPHLSLEFWPLIDPFGPSITQSDYQILIVSKETEKGGNMVNVKRQENNLDVLDVHIISLVDDANSNESEHDEKKVSSSNSRKQLLGSLLREPYSLYDETKPYIIGLTGCLASGKSSVCKRLNKLGAATIDCDRLGHMTYEKNSNAYKKIVEIFGEQILDENSNINRRKLGTIVFANKDELKKLTDIVWPEIQNLINIEISKLFQQGYKFIIVEAALLIEAEWYKIVNEVWVCIIPSDESIRRTVERDNMTAEKAKSILDSQMDNHSRVSYANVVLSTFWEPEYTQKQVEKAWNQLELRTINSNKAKL